MKNLSISLPNRPGALAEVGETLGRAGVSVEGGGMWVVGDKGVANFLVHDGAAGRQALETVGVEVMGVQDVVLLRLNQDETGQLGKLLRRMAEANVNVLTQYSDHDHQLVLVVDDLQAGEAVAKAWTQERNAPAVSEGGQQKNRVHRYSVHVAWSGNTGSGTSNYASYSRDHEISVQGRDAIRGSSDPVFRGDKTRYNPEELLIASASACHMLSYLHLCAINGVVVLSYEDDPTGEMVEAVGGPGAFVRVDLRPVVTITAESDRQLALTLHEAAHKSCFIANSLKAPVYTHAMVSAKEPL